MFTRFNRLKRLEIPLKKGFVTSLNLICSEEMPGAGPEQKKTQTRVNAPFAPVLL